MSKTPLTDIYSGAQSFLQLQGRFLKLRYARIVTDAAYKCVRYGAMAVIALIATLFFSVALALWFGQLMHSLPAGFALMGGFYSLCLIVWALYSARNMGGIKDVVVRQLDLQVDSYAELLAENEAVGQKVQDEKQVLLARLDELRAGLEDIEQRFGGGKAHTPGEANSTERSETGSRILSTTVNLLLDAFVLPKVGIVKRTVLPLVANAVMRSRFFKSGKLGSLIQKLRKKE